MSMYTRRHSDVAGSDTTNERTSSAIGEKNTWKSLTALSNLYSNDNTFELVDRADVQASVWNCGSPPVVTNLYDW